MNDYTTTFLVDQSPAEVIDAINDVRGWWSGEIEGSTDKLGGEFTYRYEDLHYSKQRITELVPDRKVTWLVVEGGPTFTRDQDEWPGTTISFEVARAGDQTEVRFTHRGLVPAYECFDACSSAWGSYVNGSLRKLIATRGSAEGGGQTG